MQITSPVWVSLPFRDWQLQNPIGLEGVGGGCGSRPPHPFYPALLHEPLTPITSGPHRPCVVPIVPLPATVSGHPQPLPLLHPFPQHPASSAQWGPRQSHGSPLESYHERDGSSPSASCTCWPLSTLTVPPAPGLGCPAF